MLYNENMKKRLLIAFCCLGLLLLFVLLCYGFTCKITGNLTISRPIEEVASQFTDLKNWQKWHPALAQEEPSFIHFSKTTDQVNSSIETSTGRQFLLMAVNPGGIVFKNSFKNKTSYQSIVASPDSGGSATILCGIRYVNVWEWLLEKISRRHKISEELVALKRFEENPLAYYGFPIEIRPVTDSLVMTGQIITSPEAVGEAYHQIYKDLTEYAGDHKLFFKPYRYVSLKPADSGNIRVALGLAVNERGPEKLGIKFLSIPLHGRLLIGNITGNVSKIKNLYAAMEKYMKENGLQRVADPLEKYEHFPLTAQDSLHISVEIQIPIY